MKKGLIILGLVLVSLIITFVLFENNSWYHFGDSPTKVVSIRLVLCFGLLLGLFISIYLIINKKVNKKI